MMCDDASLVMCDDASLVMCDDGGAYFVFCTEQHQLDTTTGIGTSTNG